MTTLRSICTRFLPSLRRCHLVMCSFLALAVISITLSGVQVFANDLGGQDFGGQGFPTSGRLAFWSPSSLPIIVGT